MRRGKLRLKAAGRTQTVVPLLASILTISGLSISGLSSPVLAFEPGSEPTPDVGVLPIKVEGKLPERVEAELQTRLQEGLGRDGVTVRMLPRDQPSTCKDEACWTKMAASVGTTHFVQFSVEVAEPDYRMRAELIDGRTGSSLLVVDETCDLCGLEEAGSVTADMAATVHRRLSTEVKPPPVLVVNTRPAGATVSVDGEPIGTTPLQTSIEQGEHQLRISREGYAPQVRKVALVDGTRSEIDVDLVAVPVDDSKRPRPLLIAGATTLGVGLGALGGGIAMLVLHERPIRSDCSGDNVDIQGDCRYLHDTQAGGIALSVIGGLATATGIALIAVDAKRNKSRKVQAYVTPSGGGLRLSF